MRLSLITSACVALFTSSACYRLTPQKGGGMVKPQQGRTVVPADVALPDGYAIELVLEKLIFPTAVVWDDRDRLYVVEGGYSYGEVFLPPRLLRVDEGGRTTVVATGEKNGPWTGIAFHR